MGDDELFYMLELKDTFKANRLNNNYKLQTNNMHNYIKNKQANNSARLTGFQTGLGQTGFSQKGHQFLTCCNSLL